MTQHSHIIILITVLTLVIFSVFEVLFITLSGSPVLRPTIPRGEQTLGTGQPLRYIVMGDSTTIAQGGDYAKGYAVATAHYLAKDHAVTWKNVGISGARAHDVLIKQLLDAIAFKPDVALIAVGANDVVHLTSTHSYQKSLTEIIAALRKQNSAVRIILTGAPDMGSVPRFPWPVKQIAGSRTQTLNTVVAQLASSQHVTFAPIAQETGPTFRAHPELFAADKFHPTNDGYQLWIPALTKAITASGANVDAEY